MPIFLTGKDWGNARFKKDGKVVVVKKPRDASQKRRWAKNKNKIGTVISRAKAAMLTK